MAPEKTPLPDEAGRRDRTSYDIIMSCFGNQDKFEAEVFSIKKRMEEETGKKIKVDKDFVNIVFENYPDKEFIKEKATALLAQIKGVLDEPEKKNFGMDVGRNNKERKKLSDDPIHKKGAWHNQKRLGEDKDD
ncbi:MAG: hypothetical protein PHH24_01295 [Candidatus Moranbacteria bacterium]|jgi:hypothetical protein|nr:hypothetical protein [Candidatus Moranbacteria bacterium]MDX9855519.1 hypothetical protein [Candidatus Moranbacteria bacterium]